jgi:hypothetical protein
MSDNVRRLALIDAEKFNSLIDLLETNTARQKMQHVHRKRQVLLKVMPRPSIL